MYIDSKILCLQNRYAAVQKITEEILTETVSLILARIPTHAAKMLNVKQMVIKDKKKKFINRILTFNLNTLH